MANRNHSVSKIEFPMTLSTKNSHEGVCPSSSNTFQGTFYPKATHPNNDNRSLRVRSYVHKVENIRLGADTNEARFHAELHTGLGERYISNLKRAGHGGTVGCINQ
ncbi:hypothetical protein QQG55_5215 [Brugia pahangi]